jgi:hypothetical protein
MMDIVQTIADPNLFQPWFAGGSWANWRTVLKGIFALPMTETERDFFRTIAQREPPKKRVKEARIIVGRRGGKDSIASLVIAHLAALFDGCVVANEPWLRVWHAIESNRRSCSITRSHIFRISLCSRPW